MTPKTLRQERIQKFDDIVADWIAESPAVTDVTGDDELLEAEIKRLCELLADASISRSEIAGEYKTDERPEMVNAELRRGDWREYPEHLHEVAKCLRDTWMFVLPEKPQKANRKTSKSQYALFIMAMEQIKQSCGEFGIKPLEETHKKWRAGFKDGIAPYTIARPTSLINVTNATALEMRQAGTSNTPKNQNSRNLND